jgi:hypothetical protein
LYLGGATGTGRSKVLHAIKSLFEKLGKQDELLVSMTIINTGIAVKLIRGSIIDSLCHFRKRAGSNSDNDLDDLADTPISGDVKNRSVDALPVSQYR